MQLKRVVSREVRNGFEFRTEVWGFKGSRKEDLEIVSCYTPNGDYVGDKQMALRLKKKGISYLQKRTVDSSVCSIGFCARGGKWCGWSHRAICGFGIGDKIFEPEYGNDKTPFVKHGRKTIKTLADAKIAASRFADYVS